MLHKKIKELLTETNSHSRKMRVTMAIAVGWHKTLQFNNNKLALNRLVVLCTVTAVWHTVYKKKDDFRFVQRLWNAILPKDKLKQEVCILYLISEVTMFSCLSGLVGTRNTPNNFGGGFSRSTPNSFTDRCSCDTSEP